MHLQPLRHGQIRLLELLPKSASDGTSDLVDAKLTHVSLATIPSFEALSYCWGSTERNVKIRLSGDIHHVTTSLGQALRDLQLEDTSRLIWADALCINQDDLIERRNQVALMRQIYQTASQVIVHLGGGWDGFELASEVFDVAAANPDSHYEPSMEPHWTVRGQDLTSEAVPLSIMQFLNRPWWSRIWTAQEYILARRVLFMTGPFTLEGSILRRAYVNLRNHWRTCCRTSPALGGESDSGVALAFFRMNAMELGRDCLGGHHEDYAAHPLEYVKKLSIKPEATVGPQPLTFLEVLDEFRVKECSDPRDKIYGVSGLYYADQVASYFVPDYSIPVEELYIRVAHRMIIESGSLDVLSRAREYCDPAHSLPSFVPDWSVALPLVDNDVYNLFSKMYDACGGQEAEWTVLDAGMAAQTKAVLADTIAEVGETYTPRNSIHILFKSWATMAGLSYEADLQDKRPNLFDKDLPFWRTISGNATKQEARWNDSSVIKTEVLDLAEPDQREQLESAAYDIFIQWLAYEAGQTGIQLDDNLAEFQGQFRYFTTRKTFAVTEGGRMAMVPSTAQKGDTVAVLPGGRKPFVLRSESTGVYEVLGGAYVHGVMMGELMHGQSIETETIVLK